MFQHPNGPGVKLWGVLGLSIALSNAILSTAVPQGARPGEAHCGGEHQHRGTQRSLLPGPSQGTDLGLPRLWRCGEHSHTGNADAVGTNCLLPAVTSVI